MSSWKEVGPATPRRPMVATAGTPRIGLSARHRGVVALYAGSIFLSAFLLFGVELIMGRLILPWFGGSAAVWTVAVLFFQIVLVLGYLYAHLLVRFVPPRRQMFVHVPVLLASLLVLPILPAAGWKPVGNEDPTLRILGLLALTVGLPFLVLSSSGPLLQAWYARRASRPYRLFAVSNGASLLGLLSYPLLIEPRLRTHVQADAWSVAYALFVLLAIAITVHASRSAAQAATPRRALEATSNAPSWGDHLRWLVLAAIPSLLFLAVTNQLTQNVAPIPLLWVLPLGVYLLSLIICFEGGRGYRRGIFLPLLPVTLALMAYNLFPGELSVGIPGQIAFFTAALLVCCMVCHGELARLKPPAEPVDVLLSDGRPGRCCRRVVRGRGLASAVHGLLRTADRARCLCGDGPVRVDPRATEAIVSVLRCPARALVVAGAAFTVLLGVYVLGKVREHYGGDRVMVRNFYGTLSVRDYGVSSRQAVRVLDSGTIVHGEQLLSAERRRPTGYYGPASGIGVLLREEDRARHPLRVGVIGLGVGTLATYGRAGDSYRFYEINPLDVDIASTQFSFLRESPAHVDVAPGDARLSLEQDPDRHFNVLAVDAFTGDSIPIHLLTLQAFQLYFSHLEGDGVVAVHVSNRHLNLVPVVARAAAALGRAAVLIENPGEPGELINKRSQWVLITGDHRLAARLARAGRGALLSGPNSTRLWTDDYSDVIDALK